MVDDRLHWPPCLLAIVLAVSTGTLNAQVVSCDPGVTVGTTYQATTLSGPTMSLVVPLYNSLPGSSHTLYLDFDGINYVGTWDGKTPGNVPAYDTDGNASTFSATELSNIHEIWARVAEAYSPFNVNVTTVSPGTTPIAGQWSQIIVAAENASGADWYASAGGVAYINGFQLGGMLYGTGWAFTNHLGAGAPKYTADAATHESGHQADLNHQKLYNPDGSLSAEYRPSSDGNLTAPIMGVSYDSLRGLWSDGTSGSATSHQYDTSILASTYGYRPQEDNHDLAHASALSIINGTSLSGSGIIEQPTEQDLFSFTTGDAQVTLNVLHNTYGGMLDSKLQLYSQDGTLLETIDPSLSSTSPDYGLDATFSGLLSAGTYYLGVASHGGYGDIGQYTVTGTIVAVPEPGTLLLAASAIGLLAFTSRRRSRRPFALQRPALAVLGPNERVGLG